MRIITDSDGRVLDVSFGALISCGGQDGTDYTGTVPTGYTSLEDWFIKEADKLYRWTVVDGELTLDSSAVAPTDKLPAADYVIEQGTSGIWTYRKWNSGIAECWGSYTTTGGSSTEGSLYWKGTSTAYPSGLFIGTPITEATLQGNWIGGILSSDSHSKDSFVGYVWTALNTSSYNFIINIRATGRWK